MVKPFVGFVKSASSMRIESKRAAALQHQIEIEEGYMNQMSDVEAKDRFCRVIAGIVKRLQEEEQEEESEGQEGQLL